MNTFHFNAIIGSCGSAWAEAFSLIGELLERRLPCSAVTYGGAMKVCARARQWTQALELLFDQMEASEVNEIVYSAAIKACAEQWPMALELLRSMCQRSLQVDAVCTTAAMAAAPWPIALELFQSLLEREEADIISFNTLLSSTEWPMALEFLAHAGDLHLSPNLVSFNTLISRSPWQHSLSLLSEARQRQLEPTVMTYNALLSGCSWTAALAILQEMAISRRLAPDIISFSTAMACLATADWTRSLELLDSMGAMQVRPNAMTYSALAVALGAAQWQRALSLWPECREAAVCNAIMGCQAWDVALELLEDLDTVYACLFSLIRSN